MINNQPIMMKNRILFLLLILAAYSSQAQQNKTVLPTATQSLDPTSVLSSMNPLPERTAVPTRGQAHFEPKSIDGLFSNSALLGINAQIEVHSVSKRPAWIKLEGEGLQQGSPTEQCQKWFNIMSTAWGIDKADEAFILKEDKLDQQGERHLHWQQQQAGIPVYGNDVLAHFKADRLFLINGRVLPQTDINLSPNLNEAQAIAAAKVAVAKHSPLRELSEQEKIYLGEEEIQTQLYIFYADEKLEEAHLAWMVSIHPHLGAHWEFMIDAQDGSILREINKICHFAPPPNGPEVTTANDLSGQSRTVHSYEFNNTNFLIDASRSMFDASNSSFPNNAQGVIWTINANNTSPATSAFNATHNTSPGNFWNDPLAVSAHYNASEAFEYFKTTFNRNSINGQGGNILSFINVADENGADMDNAFWDGQAIYYGNGNTDFSSPLAKSLDVAGHEMSHGVIQATANLEYQGESGALNESYADVFAAMIDRDDWQIGEGIVSTSTFPTNALRDLSNPHNGASQLGQAGWQPQHTNEQYFGSADNGGVHINSGIPNRAFYLLATDIGKSKAEQIYYHALVNYLTRTSNFLDMRASIIQSALDLYSQSDADAAAVAFTTVGIGSGTSAGNGGGTPTTPDDLSVNPGDEFILYSSGNRSNLYINQPDGTIIADPLSNLDPLSKPSITDDGSAIVFVDTDNHIRAILIDWAANEVTDVLTLSNSPIWRNVAISKDGLRLAAITTDNDNNVFVFDYSQTGVPGQMFELYNPTFSSGVSTGSVRYADVLEFDLSGEQLMYDAYNVIPSQSGSDIDYWDIGFMRVWNNASDDFGDGNISKLFNSLPDNTSVGNPTFAKNSSYIIALDFIDNNDNTNFLIAANTETGDVSTLRELNELAYPNYSVSDDQISFNAENTFGDKVIGSIELQSDKITAAGNAFVLLSNSFIGASWAGWFANGQRTLVNVEDLMQANTWARVFPTLSNGTLQVEWQLEQAADVHISASDLMGRTLWQQTKSYSAAYQQERIELDVAPGVYFITLQAGQERFVQKIVVE